MRRSRFALLLLAVVLVGCDSADFYDDEVGDLVLSATNEGFLLQTEEDYPCANYPLVVEADVGTRRAEVRVEGVGEIDVCLRASGPARVIVPFAEGMEFSEYSVAIEKDGRTDRFSYTCGFGGCLLTAVREPEFTRVGPR